VFIPQALDTFELDHDLVLDKQIGKILPGTLAFVENGEGSLNDCVNSSKAEFVHQGAFVYLFQGSRIPRYWKLRRRCEDTLASTNPEIRVHRRSSVANQ